MLKLFEKLELLFNKFFYKLIELIISFARKVLPRKTVHRIEDTHYNLIYKWARFKENLPKKRKLFIENAKTKKNELFAFLQDSQRFPIKQKIQEYKKNIITFFKETTLKQYFKYLWAFILFLIEKFKNLTGRFSPKMVKLTVGSTLVVMIAGYAIVNQSHYIWLQENPYRAPAVVEDFADKAKYYNRNAKTMIIRNVRIPVIVKNVREIKSITMEFSVRTSTRFAKIYLEEKEHLLKDHLFMNLQPILSSFPIEDEGKRILTEKIERELNILLQNEKVEGMVEKVRVLYIIGS